MSNIKLFLTDVDGCLTDGGMYYTAEGDAMKRFCVYDGMGMSRLMQSGVRCGILTSEQSPIVLARARKLKLDYLFLGAGSRVGLATTRFSPASAEPVELPAMSKTQAAEQICAELGITLADVCYVGDDINDTDLLSAVGLACCPPNARPEVLRLPNVRVLKTPGGQGAVREVADMILNGNV